MKKAISDLEYVKGLDGALREVVVDCYVKSFEYTHSRSHLFSSRLKSALSDLTNKYTNPVKVLSIVCSAVATIVAITWREHKL